MQVGAILRHMPAARRTAAHAQDQGDLARSSARRDWDVRVQHERRLEDLQEAYSESDA